MSIIGKKLKEAAASVIDELFDEAATEQQEERIKSAKQRVKYKLGQLQAARLVVANIEREIEDLRHELEETL